MRKQGREDWYWVEKHGEVHAEDHGAVHHNVMISLLSIRLFHENTCFKIKSGVTHQSSAWGLVWSDPKRFLNSTMFRGSSGHLKFDKNRPVEDLSWKPLRSTHLLLTYLNWLHVPSQLTHNVIFQSCGQQHGLGNAWCNVHRSGPGTCAWHGSPWISSPPLTPLRSRPSATSAWPKPPTL